MVDDKVRKVASEEVVRKYGPTPILRTPEPEEELVDGKYHYKAFGSEPGRNPVLRLEIRFRGDFHRETIAHANIARTRCTTHEIFSILCPDCVVKLEGRNLHKLTAHFLDNSIRYVQVYDPEKHHKPEDGGKPFIGKAQIFDLRGQTDEG